MRSLSMRSWCDRRVVAVLACLLLVACGDDEGGGVGGGAEEGTGGAGGGVVGDAGGGGGLARLDEHVVPTSLGERSCPPDSELTWENVGAPFILAYCTGCHASSLEGEWRREAPVGIDFDDLGAVRVFADRIWARAGDHNDTMPPIGGPPVEERRLLGEWLACGAP